MHSSSLDVLLFVLRDHSRQGLGDHIDCLELNKTGHVQGCLAIYYKTIFKHVLKIIAYKSHDYQCLVVIEYVSNHDNSQTQLCILVNYKPYNLTHILSPS